MEYLLKYVDNETYNLIDSKLDDEMVFYLCNNKINICNKIDYLKVIGLMNIKDIILYRCDILTWELEDIKNYFDKKSDMIDLINNDISFLDLI